MRGTLLLASAKTAAAFPMVVSGKAFVPASPAAQRALVEVRNLLPRDREMSTVVYRETPVPAVRFGKGETVELPLFAQPNFPTVPRAAWGDLLVVHKLDNGCKAFVGREGLLGEGKMGEFALACTSCVGDELHPFATLPSIGERKGASQRSCGWILLATP